MFFASFVGARISSDLQYLKTLAHLSESSHAVKISSGGIHYKHRHSHEHSNAQKNKAKSTSTEHTHDLAAQPTFDSVLLFAPSGFSKLEVISSAQDYSEALPTDIHLKSIFRPPIA